MRTRSFNVHSHVDGGEGVYAQLCGWWVAHGWPVVAVDALPECGVVARVGERLLAAGFVYRDVSCRFGMLELVVTNPENSARESLRAIEAVVGRARVEARRRGVRYLLTACRQASLARVYERAGFTRTDEGVTHLGCDLTEQAENINTGEAN